MVKFFLSEIMTKSTVSTLTTLVQHSGGGTRQLGTGEKQKAVIADKSKTALLTEDMTL